jgi:hypothetical protein
MRGEQGDRAGSAKCHTIPTETDRADVAAGSKPEKLNASICFPLCPRERTSRNAVGMSVSCPTSRHQFDFEGEDSGTL